MGLNRRELAFSASAVALGGATGLGQIQPATPTGAQISPFYQTFNDQLASQPAALQADIRGFYEVLGWQPAWTPERVQLLGQVIGQADRHGLLR